MFTPRRFVFVFAISLAGCALAGRKLGLEDACVAKDPCVDSYCNGTWIEGPCKVATDCPGYVDVDYGEPPLGPNKRCIEGHCYQVGRCSNDHS